MHTDFGPGFEPVAKINIHLFRNSYFLAFFISGMLISAFYTFIYIWYPAKPGLTAFGFVGKMPAFIPLVFFSSMYVPLGISAGMAGYLIHRDKLQRLRLQMLENGKDYTLFWTIQYLETVFMVAYITTVAMPVFAHMLIAVFNDHYGATIVLFSSLVPLIFLSFIINGLNKLAFWISFPTMAGYFMWAFWELTSHIANVQENKC